jgi:hypothetical protein
MTKKYINKKEVRRKISQDLQEGKAKSQILAELEDVYYDKDQLTKLVLSTPHPDIRKKFNRQNMVLGILAIALVLFRFWSLGVDYAGSGLSILTLFMAISIFSYDAISYRLMAIISLITFVRYISRYESNSYIMIDFLMTAFIVGFGFHLGNKLFPKYGIFGPKKDNNGKVIFD